MGLCRIDQHFLKGTGSRDDVLMIFRIVVFEKTDTPVSGSVIQLYRASLRPVTRNFYACNRDYDYNKIYRIDELKELWIALKKSKNWQDCKDPPKIDRLLDPF